MKRIQSLFIFCVLMTLAASVKAQSEVDQEAFDAYVSQHGYYVTELPMEKLDDQRTTIGRVAEKAETAENWGVEPKAKEFQYFRIGSTDKMLVVKSLELLRREFHSKK